jgi:Peptidase_C39 like family
MPCHALAGPACPAGGRRLVHDGIGARSQYASPGLVAAIVYRGADPAGDPRWAESGTPTRAEYGRWCGHWCGMACLAMILEHRDGSAPSLHRLLTGCVAAGGYRVKQDGTIEGLFYEPFARYAAAAHGLAAEVHRHLPASEIPARLAAGQLVIASVHPEIRRPLLPSPGRGGHLVLVSGYDEDLLHVRNPSGHTPGARSAVLPAGRFAGFYAERAICVAI